MTSSPDIPADMSHNHWLWQTLKQDNPALVFPPKLELSSGTAQAWSQLRQVFQLKDADLAAAVAKRFGLRVANFDLFQPNAGMVVSDRLWRPWSLLPLYRDGDTCVIAATDPRIPDDVRQQIGFALRAPFRIEILAPDLVETGLVRLFARASKSVGGAKSIDLLAVEPGENHTAKLAKAIFRTAIDRGASDIHLHPFVGGGVIRFRIDGLLQRIGSFSAEQLETLSRYLRNQGGMDINPFQAVDGRLSLTYGERDVDLRVSILPVFGGDRIVCRLLEQGRSFSLSRSGFATADYQALKLMISHGTGIVLLTGPTGSGKTSTLYALLTELNQVDVNIMTLENPVEYVLPGISQVQVNDEQGLGFADALRSILRQDPDIVLVGEIRDAETARIAAQAALTGHMVLSTLHTNDALSTIPRLLDLGLEPSVLADALVGVVSQRLVRKLCALCKQPAAEPLSPSEAEFLRITGERPASRPTGCEACGYSGYAGRLPIVEHLDVSPPMRQALLEGKKNVKELAQANQGHQSSMAKSATQWVVSGQTTALETQRVLGLRFWNELSVEYNVPVGRLAPADESNNRATHALQVLMLSQDDTLATEIAPALPYPLEIVSDEMQAAEYLKRHPGVIAMLVSSGNLESTPVDWLSRMRENLAWAGLPVVFLIREEQQELALILEKFNATFLFVDRADADAIATTLNKLLMAPKMEDKSP